MTQRLPAATVGLALALAAVLATRAWAADLIATPWILIDELLYSDLARSLASEGRLAVRGEPSATSVLYPLLIAPAWLADNVETAYRLAKWINVLVATAVALPVYLWGRSLAGRRAGLVAAALTLLLPAFVYTGTLMSENLFLPLFVVAAWALSRALEAPSIGRWLVTLIAVVAAVATRVQGLLLLPIAATSLLVFAALESRAGGRPARELRLLAIGAAAVLAASAAVLATGAVPGVDESRLEGLLRHPYEPGELLRWIAHDAGVLVFGAGVLPALALVLLTAEAVRRPRGSTRAGRAFVAVALSSLVWLVLLAGTASTWSPVGIRERYLVHGLPLLLIALCVWLAGGGARPRVLTPLVAASAGALVATLPLRTIFGSQSFLGDGFSLISLWRLSGVLPGGVATVTVLLVAGVIAVAAVFVLVPRRFAPALLPCIVAAFLAASSATAFATARSQALGVSLASGQAPDRGWIDAAVGAEPAVYLSLVPQEPAAWVPVWQAEFWNRRLVRVAAVDAPEPSLMPTAPGLLLPDGRILIEGFDAPNVLLPAGFSVAGTLLAESGGLRLFRVNAPLRLVAE